MFSLSKIKIAFQWSFMRTFVQQFLIPFLRLFIIPIVGPSNYGVVAITFLYFRFIEILFPFGVRDFILSRDIDTKKQIEMLHSLSFILSLCAFFLCLALSFLLPYFYDSNQIASALFATSFLFPFIGIGLVPQTIIEKKLDIKYLFYINLIPCLTSIFVAIPLAIYGYGFWAILTSHILNYSLSNMIYFLLNPVSFVLPSKDLLSKLFSFGKWNTAEKSSEYFIGWIDLFFVSFLGIEIAGIYSFGKNFAVILFTLISSPIVNIILPIFSSMKNNIKKLLSFFIDIIGISILVNIFFGFIASIVSYYLFQVFLTSWQNLNIVCLYLFISSIFARSYTLLREYLKVQNKIKPYPILMICSGVIFVLSFLIIEPSTIIDFLKLKLLNDMLYALLMTILLINTIKNFSSSLRHFLSYGVKFLFLLSFNFLLILISINDWFLSNNLYYDMGLIFLMICVNILVLYRLLIVKYPEIMTYYNN
ncbi:MAG: hypothetical protein CMG20_02210 [Candidatus Marinimicrobia bacterium]|nr:hypothetical protein [Candidatus Neomarinimicrobiota bacterium]|tara:strand:+ start:30509 stop:31939 length:1431 start_codon:yes stop_codon:yes gene_type:complete